MTKPQTVVFDLGKVLVDFDYAKSSRAFLTFFAAI